MFVNIWKSESVTLTTFWGFLNIERRGVFGMEFFQDPTSQNFLVSDWSSWNFPEIPVFFTSMGFFGDFYPIFCDSHAIEIFEMYNFLSLYPKKIFESLEFPLVLLFQTAEKVSTHGDIWSISQYKGCQHKRTSTVCLLVKIFSFMTFVKVRNHRTLIWCSRCHILNMLCNLWKWKMWFRFEARKITSRDKTIGKSDSLLFGPMPSG